MTFKRYEFYIDEFQVRKLFKPIRNKRQLLKTLMNGMKVMLVDNQPKPKLRAGKVVIVVSKMSRIFFFTDNKYFSICFPFSLIQTDSEYKFYFKDLIDVNSKITTEVLSLLTDDASFFTTCVYDFMDPVLRKTDLNPQYWPLILHLLTYEDGYIRYDHDEANANFDLHPPHHYDIFYSSKSTFKLGLQAGIEHHELIDLLSLETDCVFVR